MAHKTQSRLCPCILFSDQLLSMTRKRKQSLSPLGTPKKCGPLDVDGHTPRKDTPRRGRTLFKCSYPDCPDTLATVGSRDRHERTCQYQPQNEPLVTMKEQFLVPTHQELNLSTNHCRMPTCKKQFKTEASRKKHEIDRHRFFENRGRTVSPVFIDFEAESQDLCIRPTSCPPPQTDRIPMKRRRAASSTQVVCDEGVSFSVTCRSSSSISLSSSVSSSIDDHIYQSTYVAGPNQCKHCLFKFQNEKTFFQHKSCLYQPSKPDIAIGTVPTILTRPKHWREISEILCQLREVYQNIFYTSSTDQLLIIHLLSARLSFYVG